MTSYVLPLTLGTRTWTAQEMATLFYQLGQSGRTWLKTDGIVVRRLDDRGRLLASQVDNYSPGTRLHELYDFDFDESQPFSIRLSLKGLSQWVDLGQALLDQGFLGISPPTTLADVHMLTYLDVLPLRAGKWLAVDESQTHLLHPVKRTVNKTVKQLFEDNRSETFIRRVVNTILRSTHILENVETHIHRAVRRHVRSVRTHTEGDTVQLHQTRNHITDNYQAGITVAYGSSSFPANIVELAGLYAEDLGSQRIRVGPTALKPLIVVSQASPYTVEAQAGQTLTVPSASATDPLTGNSLSVTANPATVPLGALATHTITYSCQTSAGDLSSALLTLVVQDSSSPVVTLLGSSTVNLIVGDTYGTAEDAGARASDNLDGALTVVATGLPVDTSVASTQTVTYTATDSQNLSASVTRSLVIAPPYTWHYNSPIYGYNSGNPVGVTPTYVSHTIQPSPWRGPSAAQLADPDLVFERAYASHSAGNSTLGLGSNQLSSSFDCVVYDFGRDFANRAIVKSFTLQGQVLDSGSNRLALYVKGSNSATGPWTTIAYLQSPYWPGLLSPPQPRSYNHPASTTTGNTTGYRYIAVGYGVVRGATALITPDSGISRLVLVGDHFT